MNSVVAFEGLPSSGVDEENPWPGLVAFTEEYQKFFFGRDEEVDELRRRVERKNLTVLFGQSGLGKSSLLHAGLFPCLRAEGYLPVTIRLDHAATAPTLSVQVKAAITQAIGEWGGRLETGAADDGATVWEHFHRRSRCQSMPNGEPARLILVFDQFEELFAIGQASTETRARAASFLKELADFVENRAPEALEHRLEENPELAEEYNFGKLDCRVLFCLREDYLAHLESLRQSMPSITENRMRLLRMSGASALQAVIKPGGTLITPEVGRLVIRFVAGDRLGRDEPGHAATNEDGLSDLNVEPSLLSLICRELNGRRLTLGMPQITADLLAGNRERILQDFYERCLSDQPAAVRAFVEDELLTDSGLRENIALERARKALRERGAPASAIEDLVKRRLLHLEERLGSLRVELTHDVLTPVVKKNRDDRQQREVSLRAEEETQEIIEDELVTDAGLGKQIALNGAEMTPTGPRNDTLIDDPIKGPLVHPEERRGVESGQSTNGMSTLVVDLNRDEPLQKEADNPAELGTQVPHGTPHAPREDHLAERVDYSAQPEHGETIAPMQTNSLIIAGMVITLIVMILIGAIYSFSPDNHLLAIVVIVFGAASYCQYWVSQKHLLEAARQKEQAAKSAQEAKLQLEAVEKVFAELKRMRSLGQGGLPQNLQHDRE